MPGSAASVQGLMFLTVLSMFLTVSKRYNPEGFYQTVKEFFPLLYKLFQRIEERTLLNSFYEASITLIPKTSQEN